VVRLFSVLLIPLLVLSFGCASNVNLSALPTSEAAMTTSHASLLMEPRWAVLFSGDDLESFNEIGGANWILEEGVVSAVDGDPGFLVSKGAYTNFTLSVAFVSTSMTNSGVFIRCQEPDSVDANSCYEVNIFDDNQNPDFKTGSILRVAAPLNEVRVGDTPSILMISAIDDHIQVWVDGVLTADVNDNRHTSGYIGLQFNSGDISFSEILFRPE
jgi:hypothetical protein